MLRQYGSEPTSLPRTTPPALGNRWQVPQVFLAFFFTEICLATVLFSSSARFGKGGKTYAFLGRVCGRAAPSGVPNESASAAVAAAE